jgi:hypothetical protein
MLRQYNTEAALLALQKKEEMGGECAATSAGCGGTLNTWRSGDDGRPVTERLQVRF